MNSYINDLNWRYATKKFDPTKKISDSDLEILKEAVRLTASSYGLQPYEVIIVKDQEIKEKLRAAAYDQSQLTDASDVFIFANNTDFGDAQIDNYLSQISKVRGISPENLKGFENMMKGSITPLSHDIKNNWTARQAYIAMGNLLSAAAHLKIDSCPMEGYNTAQVNEILGLDERGLNAAVIVTVGYRSADDASQHYIKVRKPEEELFTTI